MDIKWQFAKVALLKEGLPANKLSLNSNEFTQNSNEGKSPLEGSSAYSKHDESTGCFGNLNCH